MVDKADAVNLGVFMGKKQQKMHKKLPMNRQATNH
jgi:hypothetical protein